jgi:D-arabinose 1-dehydrogenase-like Zn-dependent alcohol dehydrogenase
MSMRATLMYGAGDVRVEEVADSKLEQSTDALVRITASCVCGSDLHPYGSMSPENGPAHMGHEFIGVIEETGSDVATLTKGDLVVAPFAFSDGTCQFCRAGLQTSCEHGGFWDMLPHEGGQAEAIRVPLADGTLFKLPGTPDPALIPSLLTISDVLGTGYHAAVQGRVGPDTSVTVIGDGAVGLLAVLSAKRLGAEQIILMGRHQARTDLGREFGATDVVSSRGKRASTLSVSSPVATAPMSCSRQWDRCPPTSRRSASYAPVAPSAGSAYRSTKTHPSGSAASSAATSPSPAARLPPAPTWRSCSRRSSTAPSSPGKVFDAVTDLSGVPGAYRDMADRKALKVLIQ